ncbi:uncharacterized protein LOC133178687 [Saccostrea echinata]|uniref:uncharacterized protein LOC133178687 n=1 Tax=Saccostrea echinata TaxID=191078 RepID=UPI002A8315B9|nr:uncharacterized protein LOC133178687 [Saccostrea echinata]
MSESVFVGLCRKLGTSQLVAMRRDVLDIMYLVMNHSAIDEENKAMISGSYREGFRLKTSDIDFMAWPNHHRVIWDLYQSRFYNMHRQSLIVCDSSDSPPGFTLLYLLSPNTRLNIYEAFVRINNRYYISSSKYRHIMASTSSCNTKPHGPCASVVIGATEFDQVHCFLCDFWPPPASSFRERCRSWPQPHIVDDILRNGCHFVAIGHKLGNHAQNEWRISFSVAEQKLVNAMNHCQFLTYGLLKLFLTEVVNCQLDDGDKLLCSYHMKTAVLWMIQQNAISHWCPQNILECFWVCFKLVLKWVYEGVCPNFFIPGNNMFLSEVYGEAQNSLFDRLYGFYKKGLTFLLHSPSLKSYLINVLHNSGPYILLDDHTLNSELAIDLKLFVEIDTYVWCHPLKPESNMRYLHIIEHTIGSSPMSQTQMVVLQKLTVIVLQNLAFISQRKTSEAENKLGYTAEKKSCYMLKLAARCGCITDMLYLAMYFYKTLRYMEALSIIEVVKDKLAQPYVMHNFKVRARKYIDAVGGRSWSTKMRQTVTWDIRLYNLVHYVEELIPEQISGFQNNMPSLSVPPFIMLHMLEIFCYRFRDTVKAQRALDDLETLVHYDQGVYVDLLLRDISWQILGICQQVTGNTRAAIYSYKRSLREYPLNKIKTATEMRIQTIRNRNN